jgi:hypothetical protein
MSNTSPVDLFCRGELSDEREFIIVGQVSSKDLLLLPDNVLLNYYWIDNNNVLDISFSSTGNPVELTYNITSENKITIKRSSDSTPLCVHNNQFVFSNLLTAHIFDIQPLDNILTLPKTYSGAYYLYNFPSINFTIPTTIEDLIGQGSNGYLTNTTKLSSFNFNNNFPIAFLPTEYWDINDNLSSTIFINYLSWINEPSSYFTVKKATWISGNYINIYANPFENQGLTFENDIPMLWYNYCDLGESCGNCLGSIIYGGINCLLNTQITPPSLPLSDSEIFNGLPFIGSGPQGSQGPEGIIGPQGIQGAPGTAGPQGLRGDSIGGTSTEISWTSPIPLTLFGFVFLVLAIAIYVMIFVK